MLSVGMSPVQWPNETLPDLPAGGLDLIWEQEAAGSNPAIPTRSERKSILNDTQKSRRTLCFPMAAVEALKAHEVKQVADKLLAGAAWQENGLVFASAVGTPLDPSHVRRAFRKVCETAGIG